MKSSLIDLPAALDRTHHASQADRGPDLAHGGRAAADLARNCPVAPRWIGADRILYLSTLRKLGDGGRISRPGISRFGYGCVHCGAGAGQIALRRKPLQIVEDDSLKICVAGFPLTVEANPLDQVGKCRHQEFALNQAPHNVMPDTRNNIEGKVSALIIPKVAQFLFAGFPVQPFGPRLGGFDYRALHWADKQKPLGEVAGSFSVFPEAIGSPPVVPEEIDTKAPVAIPAEKVNV